MHRDREWFDAHPYADTFRRPAEPADYCLADASGVTFTGRVTVRRITEGARTRTLPGVVVHIGDDGQPSEAGAHLLALLDGGSLAALYVETDTTEASAS